jgi:hypothetical protein
MLASVVWSGGGWVSKTLIPPCFTNYMPEAVKSKEPKNLKQVGTITNDGFALIKPGQTYFGGQGFTYGAGASAETSARKKST